MDILFIANRFPYPPYRGDKLKIYNLAKRLSAKHNLYLLTFIQDKSDYQYVDELKKIFSKVELVYLPKSESILNCATHVFSSKPYQVLYFQSAKFKKLVQEFVEENNIDVIHTQHLRMAQYALDIKGIKRILDLPDAFSMYWKRRSNIKRNMFIRLFDYIEYKKVVEYEKVLKKFDLNLVCSVEDREFLVKEHQTENIKILPNGVDLESFSFRNHDYSISDRIIFTGNMDYAPNIDAVVYFVNDIFPIILKKFPEVKLYIVGQRPVQKVLDLVSDKVIITGFVKDLGEEYNKSTLLVAPIRFGAGTLNKVLESMSMGVPVVCTEIGYKGLGIESGEGAILATNTADFAQRVIELLSDENLRRKTGQKGVEVILNKFSWEKITQQLESYFIELKEEKIEA